MSLYSDAAAGVLTEAVLDRYLEDYSIDDQSAERGNGTVGLTPLALAAQNGHVDTVKLLLHKGAEVDGLSSERRTPLWIATARGRNSTRRHEIVGILLDHRAKADYSDPALHSSSAPLENELKRLRDPEVIRLLVEHGGTTEEAKKLAAELGEPEIDDAMQSTQQRSQLRSAIAGLISAIALFIIAWADNPEVTAIIDGVFERFAMGGDKEGISQPIEGVSEPKSKEDFRQSISTFVRERGLHDLFPEENSPLLETLISKAVDLQNNDNTVLGQSTNLENLVKFALYQPVIYCDDSGSMNPTKNTKGEDRWADQKDLVCRIASICTQVVPDDFGVHLRFINTSLGHDNNLRMSNIEKIMSNIQPRGSTEIGVNLRRRILEPLVYNTEMTRPLFVSIVTDGIPKGPPGSHETRDTLRDEIIKCQDWLLANGLPSRAVVFQISQIGSEESSKKFLQSLKDDTRLTSVYITTQQLDSKFRDLKQNERDLEAWLFQTLLAPVLES
ncbi:ankyrin repeat protein [Stachybotrys elegans]|uniref:Ankyrin repeat protein n=1 Tax=Stachybotrys elegans TaxID=80388 RepID=A0A8K0SH73_9HYPO|nr:ankyrin repeat protein [Stachybotrys elegans]